MTTAVRKVHGVTLALFAMASYLRMLAAGMPLGGINSSYRSIAEQKALFLERYKVQLIGVGPFNDVRWYAGKRYVRISSKGSVGVPGTSQHGRGLALDVSTTSKAHAWMLKNAAAHGWKRTIAAEPWHWEYALVRDLMLIAALQRAVRTGVDRVWGAGTEKALQAVRAASKFGGRKFPSGVKYAQARVGTKTDGYWKTASAKAHDATVRRVRVTLGLTSSPTWDKTTDTAFLAARKALKK